MDESSANGHLFRACLLHRQIARAPAATALEAAAPLAGKAPRGRKAAEALEAKRQLEEEDWLGLYSSDGLSGGEDGVDIHGSCVEEICLLQAPVSTVESRLRALLVDYPDHPVLAQLSAICIRCLSLPSTSPLKSALTGLELLLARALVWEETAAKFVSIATELNGVAALATRWRQLELASWRTTLKQALVNHASGARKSWFHLYGLLVLGIQQQQQEIKEPRSEPEPAQGNTDEERYRSVAASLEAFLQTSTIGEFEARLQLLSSFADHLATRDHLATLELDPSKSSSHPINVTAALTNTVSQLTTSVTSQHHDLHLNPDSHLCSLCR